MTQDKFKATTSANPLLIVISGFSGVGKDATLDKMKKAGFPFHYVVTATTRQKRPGEKDRVDYHFLSEGKFRQMIKTNQFLEWAMVYDNYYGVPRQEIEEALRKGQDTIVKVDVQGAATIKKILPDAVFIFLTAPSTEELANRLRKRHSAHPSDLDLRLSKAQEEVESLPLFDYVVVSHTDNLDLTVTQINDIITAEKCRSKPRVVKL